MASFSSNSFDPQGSVCIVTGGANGIGRALCLALAKAGARKIIVVDLDAQAIQETIHRLPPSVGVAMMADCGQERALRRVIYRTEGDCGPIDAFFCNAGLLSTGGLDVPNDEWEQVWRVNVMQSVYVARHLFPLYQARQKGVLVVTASAAGLLNMPGAAAYAVTKHAAVAMAEWLAFTYKAQGIHVACLCPQAVRTDMIAVGAGDGGPAGIEGVLEPNDVAQTTLKALADGKFLILPHENVSNHMIRKAKDNERFLKAMEKIHFRYGEDFKKAAPKSRL